MNKDTYAIMYFWPVVVPVFVAVGTEFICDSNLDYGCLSCG